MIYLHIHEKKYTHSVLRSHWDQPFDMTCLAHADNPIITRYNHTIIMLVTEYKNKNDRMTEKAKNCKTLKHNFEPNIWALGWSVDCQTINRLVG